MSIYDRIKAVSDEFASLPQRMEEKSTAEWLCAANDVFKRSLALGRELSEKVNNRRGSGFVYFLAEMHLNEAASKKEGSGMHIVSALCTIRPGHIATEEECRYAELLLSVLDNKGVMRDAIPDKFWVGLQNTNPTNAQKYKCCGRCFRPQSTKVCGGCKMIFYCSAKCQAQDWGAHKPQCAPKSNSSEAKKE